ncbi:MAG TPA: phosphate/phosphite/phosphonate ABC transporter substrate-binding protein [Anaerolineales bacterium]|nr:phosphate/phosphite/phosphonate ABC transporter substrate-binding protein [Anaerolineales bacterium]
MFNKFLKFITFTAVMFSVVGCAVAPTSVPTAVPSSEPTIAPPRALVLGEISDNPEKKTKQFQSLADYLGANLSQFGITSGEVKIASDLDTMVQWLKDGTVDMYFASPYPAMIVNDQAGAQIILRRWKDGVSEYKTLIMVRKDSGIQSLADLRGRVIAFDNPDSTTAYMLPLAYMIEAGLKTVELPSADSAVPADAVGYVFALDQDTVTDWLVTGKVSAGAFSDLDLIDDVPAEVRDQIIALVETEPLPRYLTLTWSGMDPGEVEAIKALLISLNQTPEGLEILKTNENTAKFDEVPNTESMLTRMRQLYELVNDQ